ncbi:hypothetical protein BC828DRAFT_416535 [Blastocladiella britannica]|nr:hypothetical protein BC828DRAFT_416535 [Blastocladiella britannica]
MSSPAEIRAEARRRRMMQSPEDRLARIKALSQGTDPNAIPLDPVVSVSSTTPTTSTTSTTVTPIVTKEQPRSVTPSAAAAAPAPVPVAVAKPVPAPAVNQRSTGPVARSTAGPITAARKQQQQQQQPPSEQSFGTSPQERMMLSQLQARAYATASHRWRQIHTLVAVVAALVLFVWVHAVTTDVHVDGDGLLGNMLYGVHEYEQVPTLNVFSILVAIQLALAGARHLLDPAATNPPMNPQLAMVAGMGGGPGLASTVSGWARSLHNIGFAAEMALSDFCHFLVVFGVGMMVCAYRASVV